jgi:hypothetical protein
MYVQRNAEARSCNHCCSGNEIRRLRLKCDGTRAETRFRLSAKRTSPFKSKGASVQSTTGSRRVRISGSNGSNAGYTMFRGSVKSTGYPLYSPVSPSPPPPVRHSVPSHFNCTLLHTVGACVALGTQHAMRKSHNVICGLPRSTIFFHIIS